MIRAMLSMTILAIASVTGGCAATTPLLLAETAGHGIARRDEDIKVRAAAALKEEPDLLTFSVHAISRERTGKAVVTYMKGYADPDYNNSIKSLALYQVALIYMNRYNSQRDDAKARAYFRQHLLQFPESRIRKRVEKRLQLLDERAKAPVDLNAKQLLQQVNRAKLLSRPNIPFDAEMTPMSERAIVHGRVRDAEDVYLVLYSNEASSDDMRARALYQLGLIYMSPYNQQGSHAKALDYFRRIPREFPDTSTARKAQQKVSELINRQH